MRTVVFKWMMMICLVTVYVSGCKNNFSRSTGATPPSHQLWDSLLQAHVSPEGITDYNAFITDSVVLNRYLDQLQSHLPDASSWTKNEILAWWINAYNAYTIQLVIRHYPVNSIKDIQKGIPFISSVWDLQFIPFDNDMISLNTIEHHILRKMEEPRIHFAINCASKSCPALLQHAYFPETLHRQLDEQARRFINDPSKNIITENAATLSSIFSWFTADFTKNGSLKDFINQYADVKIAAETPIRFMDYNWQLNGK